MGERMMGSGRGTRRVTSTDVAADAGVSQATVARVFSSPALVAEATRHKVESAARRLGYTPNAIARSLKQQRTDIIGAVVPAYGEYWQHVLTAFSRQLADAGRQLLLFSFPDGGDVDAVLATVDQFRVDGLLLASANISPAHLARVWSSGVPVVAFNQPAAAGVAPSVSVDNGDGMRQIVRHLVDVGCRTVQYVGGVRSASTDQLRYLGAAQELAEHGIACPYVEAGSFAYDAGYKTAAQFADAADLPDAVIVAGDELAFGVIDGLDQSGVSVPDDVLVTGFDGLPQATWAGYDLTTVSQPIELLVQTSVASLLQPDPSSPQPLEVVTPGQLRVGASTTRTPASTKDDDDA